MRRLNRSYGKVIIAGAGPGDPELVTLKTLRYLETADVVIADRLVSPELLGRVKKHAIVRITGKQGGNENSASQDDINSQLIEDARCYALILRLKGGDVSIFSNLLDELEVLTANGIPYELVPGVSAASGAAAYAGIPLTARRHAAGVRFLTYCKPEANDDWDWNELARTKDTLVFYMTGRTIALLVEKLLDHGVAADKYVAVIGQATTPHQQVKVFNIYEFEAKAAEACVVSPTLIIIGKVAQLHHRFRWLPEFGPAGYFKPLVTVRNTVIPKDNLNYVD